MICLTRPRNPVVNRYFLPIIAASLLIDCAKTTVTINSEGGAQVDKLTLGNWLDKGESLGKTPLTLAMSEVEGSLVRISQAGKVPVFWTPTLSAAESLTFNIKLVDQLAASGVDPLTGGVCQKNSLQSTNRVMRVILKAYKALADSDYKKVLTLADEASALDENLAAPYIVKAIAQTRTGDLAGARVTLAKAEKADPDDEDIRTLAKTLPDAAK